MSWKPTIVMAAVLVVLLAIYLVAKPPGEGTRSSKEKVIKVSANRISRIEIAQKGRPATILETAIDAVGPHWRIRPQDSPVDPDILKEMTWGVERLLKAGAMDPGRPETALAITGLDDPRLVVRLGSQEGKQTLRFGKVAPTNPNAVFYQVDDDPRIYLTEVATFQAYDKPPSEIRSKLLVRYAPMQVVRFELEKRFTKGEVKKEGSAPQVVKPARAEYEKSICEKFEKGEERGWFLTWPYRERLDDLKVNRLTGDLAGLTVEEFRPAGDPKEQGFEEPEVKVSLALHGVQKPIEVHFGATTEGGRKRYARVPGSGEVGLIDVRKFGELATERKLLRSDALFPFSKESVKTFQIEARGLGKVRIERRETRKPNDPVTVVSWELGEPAGVRVEKDRVEKFLSVILVQRITNFLGPQKDLIKTVRLDPADVTVTVELRDGKQHVLHFGLQVQGYLRREGLDEVFEVDPDLVTAFRRLELNFRHPEVFNVPRDKLRLFEFESRIAPPISYQMAFDPKIRKWAFTDPEHRKEVPDDDHVGGITALLNYIQAESFVGRDPETAAQFKLNEKDAPARLIVLYDGNPGTAEFYISKDESTEPGQHLYYAMLKGSPIVFKLNTLFVETLKKVPVREK